MRNNEVNVLYSAEVSAHEHTTHSYTDFAERVQNVYVSLAHDVCSADISCVAGVHAAVIIVGVVFGSRARNSCGHQNTVILIVCARGKPLGRKSAAFVERDSLSVTFEYLVRAHRDAYESVIYFYIVGENTYLSVSVILFRAVLISPCSDNTVYFGIILIASASVNIVVSSRQREECDKLLLIVNINFLERNHHQIDAVREYRGRTIHRREHGNHVYRQSHLRSRAITAVICYRDKSRSEVIAAFVVIYRRCLKALP